MSEEGNNKNVPVIKQETLEKLLLNFKEIKKKLEEEGIEAEEPVVKDEILSIVIFFINYILKEDDLLELYANRVEVMPIRGYGVLTMSQNRACSFSIRDSVLLEKMVYKDIKLTEGLNEEEMEEFKKHLQSLCKEHNDGLVGKIFFALYKKEQKKNKHLNDVVSDLNNLVLKSQEFAKSYSWKSMFCFGLAFIWFLICEFCNFSGFSLQIIDNTILMHFFESQIYQKEIFIFLSRLLFKLPSFVLCLVGAKFFYLFVHYKTEERELLMLDKYLKRIPSDCTKDKAELVKQLASHFFPDKKAIKISQGFLQELMLKMMEKINR